MRTVRSLVLLLLVTTPATASASGPALGAATAAESFVRHGGQGTVRTDGLHLSGDLYIDTGYERSQRGLASEGDIVFWLQQGRFMLQAMALRTEGELFFQAQGQLLAHVDEIQGDQHIDTDDAWAKFGRWDAWDIQVGRYEAWQVYHKGQGLERDTLEDLGAADGPDIYEVNYALYRQDGFGQAAAQLYPTDWLRFELGAVFGNDLGFNSVGVRPATIVDLGGIKLKLAGEWRQLENQEEGKLQESEQRGVGGSVQFFHAGPDVTLPVEAGVNAAFGVVDRIDPFGRVDVKGSTDTLSLGGFLNAGVLGASLGLGINWTQQGDRQENDTTGDTGRFDHLQAFASIRRSVIVPEATAKLVMAYAKARLEPAYDNARDNEMYSLRVRVLYSF